MDIQIDSRPVTTEEEFASFRSALQAAGLPYQDLDYKKHFLIGYFQDNELIGTGALEFYAPYALLRSLSVRDVNRGQALGSRITDELLAEAKKRNVKSIYLLTESARLFFKRKGFREIERAQAPDPVQSSSEFSAVCPTTAVCMEFITKGI